MPLAGHVNCSPRLDARLSASPSGVKCTGPPSPSPGHQGNQAEVGAGSSEREESSEPSPVHRAVGGEADSQPEPWDPGAGARRQRRLDVSHQSLQGPGLGSREAATGVPGLEQVSQPGPSDPVRARPGWPSSRRPRLPGLPTTPHAHRDEPISLHSSHHVTWYHARAQRPQVWPQPRVAHPDRPGADAGAHSCPLLPSEASEPHSGSVLGQATSEPQTGGLTPVPSPPAGTPGSSAKAAGHLGPWPPQERARLLCSSAPRPGGPPLWPRPSRTRSEGPRAGSQALRSRNREGARQG